MYKKIYLNYFANISPKRPKMNDSNQINTFEGNSGLIFDRELRFRGPRNTKVLLLGTLVKILLKITFLRNFVILSC